MTSSSSWRSTLDPQRIIQTDVTHWQAQEHYQRTEQLTIEEPFEIRIDHRSLAVIMRTPGNDFELAWGFLFSEGLIQHVTNPSEELLKMAVESHHAGNHDEVWPLSGFSGRGHFENHGYLASV